MKPMSSMKMGIGIFVIQVLWCGIGVSQSCSPGFGSDLYLFSVPRETLQKGTKIGTVLFNDCSGRTHTDFLSTDTQYHVDQDGSVKLKRQITLNRGYKMFSVHAWDSTGKKHTALVRVEHQSHHGQQEDVEQIPSALTEPSSVLQLFEVSKTSSVLRRRKREWVIPPIYIPENQRGPYPKTVVQIKSGLAKETRMEYKITGEGANEPPVGIFTIDKASGWLYVSKPLDREENSEYKLQAHAYSPVDSSIKDNVLDFIVHVTDQNDNRPVFTQNPFIGIVPESSKKGFEFMTVSATDADAPNSDNSDVRYSILSQLPLEPAADMFAINPITGVIRVNNPGLDREKYGKYSLEIQAADTKGEGLSATGKAVITVTDSNDKSLTLYTGIYFTENDRGPFPKQVVQVHLCPFLQSSHAKNVYSITGEGADQPPVGLFTIDKDSGWLSVTKPLDRETKDVYVLQARAVGDGLIQYVTEITLRVIDQNDNKPVFTQDPFSGSVPEGSKIGFEFMTIVATDLDDPNTDNADIRYSIISQDPALPQPHMFEINPISGVIHVNAEGLDKEKYPKYVLEIQAADMQGNGLQSRGKADITVTA